MSHSSIAIAKMTAGDIGFATELTNLERWGYVEADLRRLIYLEPDGCFVARRNGMRVGIVTTTSYGDYAFLGCLIVKAEFRGANIGKGLMKHALAYLSGIGVDTVEIDGVFPAVPLYRRLGFHDKYLSLRMVRPSTGRAGPAPTTMVCGVEELGSFDEQRTGIKRRRVLKRYFDEFADSLCVLRKRRISAYAFVRSRPEGRRTIAPLVADSPVSAERLLDSVLARYPDTSLSLGVPEINQDMVKLLLQRGFHHTEPSVRMFLGKRVDYEDHVYGILSPDKG